MNERRRWLDGPRWPWLCKILGHQKYGWSWYSYCRLPAQWHRNLLVSMNGLVCRRCGEVYEHLG